ncbi:MAG: type II toxin-antitoxin system Phd/YefM family antitoxin [Ramlibacter sp.]
MGATPERPAFTIRDLRDRCGELMRDAEAGKLSAVTKHGQPVIVAVPFTQFEQAGCGRMRGPARP